MHTTYICSEVKNHLGCTATCSCKSWWDNVNNNKYQKLCEGPDVLGLYPSSFMPLMKGTGPRRLDL